MEIECTEEGGEGGWGDVGLRGTGCAWNVVWFGRLFPFGLLSVYSVFWD